MTWNIADRFPSWGEAGESPPNGFFYEGGDQVNEKHLDYLWNSVKGLEDDVQSALDDIDSNGDGTVDIAETIVDFDEKVDDDVANLLTEGTNVTLTYDDAGNSLEISSPDTNLSDEAVQDIVGAFVQGLGEVTVTYDDGNDTLFIDGFSGDHADLTNVQSDQHHSRYTDGEAVGAVNGFTFNNIGFEQQPAADGLDTGVRWEHNDNWSLFSVDTGVGYDSIWLQNHTEDFVYAFNNDNNGDFKLEGTVTENASI